jgi:hypothetical protein
LLNPAQRAALGLADTDGGVLVGSVFDGGATDGKLRTGDVILSVDGRPIASDGKIELDGERVEMAEAFERKFKGDKAELEIVRDGKKEKVALEMDRPWPFEMQARSYDKRPRYVAVGGLVFQPLNRDFLDTRKDVRTRLRYFFDNFVTDHLYREHPEVIVLSDVLRDPANTYARPFTDNIVSKINGKDIRTLQDVSAAFSEEREFHVVELLGEGRPIVLESAALPEAEQRIKLRYGVMQPQNL